MMNRIVCTFCGWKTRPHFSILDCIKEKEAAHSVGLLALDTHYGIRLDAHNSSFTEACPKCGRKTKEEYRWFSDEEIKGGAS